ncbi:diguanylate cyclase domain-containing protein [Cupriavidus agavae]|uniref:Diguanylate cyclase n=1 Tax=Cupriavidus agavae TaxID=1001822 RepID=A0A4Q7RSB3_9BURK|nr:diguanylate cyclase [Cupriavidus agavae]RZT35500.1 diguanylate cyclase [Cupriavidus agavae]
MSIFTRRPAPTDSASRRRVESNQDSRLTLYGALRRAHLGVALIAVLTAGIALTVVGLTALRAYADHNLRLVARSISYTVEAAVVFRDKEAVLTSLSAITATENVAGVTVLDTAGNVLAEWHRTPRLSATILPRIIGDWLTPDPVDIPVSGANKVVGIVRASADPTAFVHFLLQGAQGVLVCLLLTAVAAHYLSHRMMRDIVAPLKELMRVAHTVRSKRAFSHRLPAARIAELNELSDDFNALLAELESWQMQLQREKNELALRASHDGLTGLLNRSAFLQALETAVKSAAVHGHFTAVLYLDSDKFKSINDHFGHAAGDKVLVGIAQRLIGCVRESDAVARLGGDEFAVLIRTLRQPQDAVQVAENIISAMCVPFPISETDTLNTGLSIGLAIYPIHAQSASALLDAADAAMYEAKRDAKGTWRDAAASSSGG